ncbi:hypothetical protein [Leucobacter luti]|uniref:hypothetical protein n=1 Tax=Leucobacter luti TaxID=340320 RepID=UPI00102C64DF|nr:hypothetical protein [Leucobacter luti]
MRARAPGSAARSAARPSNLLVFVGVARRNNSELRDTLAQLWGAWSAFVESCTCVRIDAASFISGFHKLISESEADSEWIARIAAAFAMAGAGTLNSEKLAVLVTAPPRALRAEELLRRLESFAAPEIATLIEVTPGLAVRLQSVSAEKIAEWWAGLGSESEPTELSRRQSLLLLRFPGLLASLDGVPIAVRIRANRLCAPKQLREARTELRTLAGGPGRPDPARETFLRREISYLQRVRSGQVQLYLYDRNESRIVEVLGDIGPSTERSITYVPGTYTSLESFYTGGVQQVGEYLTEHLPGSVTFVYKDGLFPGEEQTSRAPRMLRITEANDGDRARLAGAQLERFNRGMRADPQLATGTHIGIGHSWGLANLTSSEVAGSSYDTVVSLSGAGMLPEWEGNPNTGYFDLSYPDLLQGAQQQGYVWRGNTPRSHPRFTNIPYYRGQHDEVLDSPSLKDFGKKLDVLTRNHNLIATRSSENQMALDDLRELVSQ